MASGDAEGVFVCACLQADTGFVAGLLKLDDAGRIETDTALSSSVPGVFAAGDIRSGAGYLPASAAADGAAAAQAIQRYLRL